MSIWFAIQAQDNVIYGIVGKIMEIDIQQYIFLTLLILGCILIFLTFFGLCTAVKRYCFCHCLFAIFITLCTAIFLGIGIAIIIISQEAVKEIDELCDSNNSDSDLAKSLNEIYDTPDSFYCIAPNNGCTCFVTHTPTDNGSKSYVMVETSATVRNVQGCSAFIIEAFKDYNVDFSDIQDAIEYFDLFGEIEEGYS